MTLWHLLIGIASMAPLIQGLMVGAKAGVIGVLIGLVVGGVVHVFTFLGLNLMGDCVAPHAFKSRSGVVQGIAFVSLYFSALLCGVLIAMLSELLVRFMTSQLGT